MADGILTSCNVARSWHWFHQVTAPCNATCGSGIMTVNSPSGSRPSLQRDTWLWDDMSLNSPGASTLQSGMWLRNHDSEFARWQHHAMLHVALGSWHWIRQVAAPCNVAGGLGWHAIEFAQTFVIIFEFYIWFWFRPYHRSQHIILHHFIFGRKNDVMSIFKMVDLRHLGF